MCEFSALQHIPDPCKTVREMLWVARKAVFISDVNNFAQGGAFIRTVKEAINAFGLWPLADWIKTWGKGYTVSDGDGIAYSYSVFNDLPIVRRDCKSIHFLSTSPMVSTDLYSSASHIAILGIKA